MLTGRSILFLCYFASFQLPVFCQNGPNLIKNGDFEAGRKGFSSGYFYTGNNTTEGEYFVGRHPDNWYHLHYPCGDHSNGSGQMLLVNGSPQNDMAIWESTSPVKPGTLYIFSFWLTSISKPNPAELAIYINGTQAGSIIRGSSNTCIWTKHTISWFADNKNMAIISIRNKNTVAYGNDFAIDDIYFGTSAAQPNRPDCSSRIPARFEFTVSNCFKTAFKLQAGKSKRLTAISWYFGDGSSSTAINPVHQYKKAGTYKVTAIVSSRPSCTDTFTRNVQIKPAKAGFSMKEQGQPGKIAFLAMRNGHSLRWDFGDGEKSNDESIVVHQYMHSGDYTATLYATSTAGCFDSIQKSIAVVLPEKIPAEQSTAAGSVVAVQAPSLSLEKREKDIIKTIAVVQDSVTVLLYDNGIIDGDSITLLLDEQVLLTHRLLTSNPLRLTIPVSRNKERHELTMYAENLGSIPPNTAYMVILDGAVKYEIYISSSKKSNGVVLFTRDPGNRPFD